MAQLEVVTYPNKILKKVSKPVERFDKELHKLLDDMYDTMIAKNGVGLAAIQVAVPLRALIIDIGDESGNQSKDTLIEVINPEFLEWSGTQRDTEGCLSVPEYYDEVERYKNVKVKFYDRYGNEKIMEADGLLSVAFQHETDHLDGQLFVERLDYIRRKKFEKEWKKLLKKQKK
ncbi:MAG: peptide deformylase [Epsilonproteobacteria bacterium]|nr:peptide deformylase [Campylobacterota bacterium]